MDGDKKFLVYPPILVAEILSPFTAVKDRNLKKEIDLRRIAEAINSIKNNFIEQPSLADIAKQVHLNPSHF